MSSIVCHLKMAFSVIFALLLGCGFSACRKPAKNGEDGSFNIFGNSPKVNYPIERVISDKSGRPLEATIVGRSATELFVVRKSDGSEFPIGIADLSQSDREFADGLPKVPAPQGFGEKTNVTKKSEDHGYIKFREAEIARLREKNQILENESAATNNNMLIKSRAEQIEKNSKEISDMLSDIARYKIDHNLD